MKHRCFGCWCLEDESTAKYAKRMKKDDTRFFCKACCKKIKNGEEVKNTVCKKKEKITEPVKFLPFEETDEYKSQVEEGRNYRKRMQGRIFENELPTDSLQEFERIKNYIQKIAHSKTYCEACKKKIWQT